MTENAKTIQLKSAWNSGLTNLVSFEIGHWWKTKRWWLQTLVWVALIDGPLALAVWLSSSEIVATQQIVFDLTSLTSVYVGMASFFGPFGIIILMHGSVLAERQSGITSWILSKPVSRLAYIVSKFIGNATGILFSIVLIPGILAYLILSIGFVGNWLPASFLGALGLIAIEALFYIALTLMLSTVFKQQIPVLAVAIGFFLSQQFIILVVPAAVSFLPLSLSGVLFTPLALTQKLVAVFPILINLLWIGLLICLAIYWFKKEEF